MITLQHVEMKTSTEIKPANGVHGRWNDLLFILWAGGAALLSYSLVYALRKPFTAASFDGLEAFGLDYKVLVTVVQIFGYLLAKLDGIKFISELKKENRLRFILFSISAAEVSLVAFGLLPAPYNIFAMFFNGLSLGCMWGVIFSFIEGRRMTDILASLLGISIVISSGVAKSIGLFVMNTWHISEFWMPAFIGAFALPVLALLGYSLTRLPQPTAEDIAQKSDRKPLSGRQRKELFFDFMPFLVLLFVANLLLVVLRDIKEDFLVKIIDVSGHSSWLFAQVDSIVTLIILVLFGTMVLVKNNLRVLLILLGLVIAGTLGMTFMAFYYDSLQLSPITWLFLQSLCLYVAYLCFQSTFDLRFHQSPGAVLALTNSRRMGMAYTYSAKLLFFSGGLFTDNDLSNVKNAAQGYALDARVVYRPLNEAGKLFHLGIAAIRRTPDGTTEADEVRDVFAFQSPGISTIDKRTLYQAQADHALFQWKTGVELLFSYHRFFLQSEYLRARVHRRDAFADYTAEGFYAQCSWLLRGHTYLYDEAMACPSRPDGRSLELCVRFNHLDLNDSPAGIWGGSEQDVSLGLNYYHNKHVGFKVSYGYLMPGTHSPVVSSAFGVLQARAQFIF